MRRPTWSPGRGRATPASEHQLPPARWTLADIAWAFVPLVAIAAVAAYFAASIALGASPPFAVVDGQSMRPTYTPGDLIVIRGIAAEDVEKGDIISITVPEEVREDKGLPGVIVHRVVKIRGEAPDLTFITQGDNNPGIDAFVTRPGDIRGEAISSVSGLGYPVLFFRAQQGLILLAALGLALVGYFVIAAVERRQEAAQLESPREAIEELAAELERLVDEQEGDRATLSQLVSAVDDYGRHLQSHTAAVKDLARAAQDLATAAALIEAATAARGVSTPSEREGGDPSH